MGCGSSRAVVAVQPMQTDENEQHCKDKNNNMINSTKSNVTVKRIAATDKKLRRDGSTDSLQWSETPKSAKRSHNSQVIKNGRGESASSRGTVDSGVFDSERGSLRDENVISEESSPELVQKLNEKKRPETPDLSVDGKKIPGRGSGKARHRKALMEARKSSAQSQQSSTEILASTSVPQRHPESLAFDIMLCPDVGNVKKRPERLVQLQQQSVARRKKKSKKATSKKDIEQKLRDADERRKIVEQEKQIKARQSQRAAHSETPVVPFCVIDQQVGEDHK